MHPLLVRDSPKGLDGLIGPPSQPTNQLGCLPWVPPIQSCLVRGGTLVDVIPTLYYSISFPGRKSGFTLGSYNGLRGLNAARLKEFLAIKPPESKFWQATDQISVLTSVAILAQMEDDWTCPPDVARPFRVEPALPFPEGVGGRDDFEHKKLCRAKVCTRCVWLRNRGVWCRRYTWLED